MTRRTRASATGSCEALLRADAQVTYAAPFTAYGRQMPDGVTGIDLPRSVGRHRLPAIRAARVDDPQAGARPRRHPAPRPGAAGRRRRPAPPPAGRSSSGTCTRTPPPRCRSRAGCRGPARPLAALTIRLAEAWAERRVKLLLAEDAYVKRFRRGHPVVPNSVIVPAEPAAGAGAGPRGVRRPAHPRPRRARHGRAGPAAGGAGAGRAGRHGRLRGLRPAARRRTARAGCTTTASCPTRRR